MGKKILSTSATTRIFSYDMSNPDWDALRTDMDVQFNAGFAVVSTFLTADGVQLVVTFQIALK